MHSEVNSGSAREDGERGEFCWGALAARVVHPVQVQVIEAMQWIDRPLSTAELVRIFDHDLEMGIVAHHIRRLAALEAIAPTGTRRVRGAVETYYRLETGPRRS